MGLLVDEGLFIDSFAYMQVGYVYKLHFPSLILDKDTEKLIYICRANSLYMERKILIVDDEADIREILQFNLENAGYTADCAASAEEALEILGPEHGLILLDVMMGGMSGFAMAKMLRTELDNQIPIIFLTAKTTENDLLTGFLVCKGVNDITKLVDLFLVNVLFHICHDKISNLFTDYIL